LVCRYIVRSTEEAKEEETVANGTAPMSTSNTLVLSEGNRTAADTSPPPEHNPKASTPVLSSRAPPAKKAKTGVGHAQEVVAGSSSTPYLEDVSLCSIEHLFCLSTFSFLMLFSYLVELRSALDEGSHPPGLPISRFRDEAATLRGKTCLAFCSYYFF
jgi:hypothetical protein